MRMRTCKWMVLFSLFFLFGCEAGDNRHDAVDYLPEYPFEPNDEIYTDPGEDTPSLDAGCEPDQLAPADLSDE